VFESKFERFTLKTDENGEYRADIQPTSYRIQVKSWIGKLNYPLGESNQSKCFSYFRDIQRSGFDIKKGEELRINFVLTESECPIEDGGRPIGEYGMFGLPTGVGRPTRTRFEIYFAPSYEFGGAKEVVIQYGSRTVKNESISYLPEETFHSFCTTCPGLSSDFPKRFLIITHGAMTFYVPEATFENRSQRIVANGRILVEDGKKKFLIKKLLIYMKNGSVVIEMKR
jgi:hypothetical protein